MDNHWHWRFTISVYVMLKKSLRVGVLCTLTVATRQHEIDRGLEGRFSVSDGPTRLRGERA